MRNISIAIPSKGRVDTFARNSSRFISGPLLKSTNLFVPEAEKKEYGILKEWKDRIITYDDSMTLRDIRQFIVDHQTTRYLLLMDDDLKIYRRLKMNDKTSIRLASPESFGDCIKVMYRLIRHKGVAAVGLGYGKFCDDKPSVVDRSFALQLILLDLEILKSEGIFFKDSSVMSSDVYVNLSLILKGYRVSVLYDWVYRMLPINSPGGCSTYRSRVKTSQSIKFMMKKFPDYVYRYEGKIHGGAVQEGIKVRWKKAYEESE